MATAVAGEREKLLNRRTREWQRPGVGRAGDDFGQSPVEVTGNEQSVCRRGLLDPCFELVHDRLTIRSPIVARTATPNQQATVR